MMNKKIPVLTSAMLTAALLLGGCSMFSHKDNGVACPETGIVKKAARLQLPGGVAPVEGKTPPPGVQAVIADFNAHCAARKGVVEMDLNVLFQASNTLAETGKFSRHLPYFIAVLSPDQHILQRTAFSTTVDFDNTAESKPRIVKSAADAEPGADDSARKAGRTAEAVEQHVIKPPGAAGTNPADYTVAIGFALSPSQQDDKDKR